MKRQRSSGALYNKITHMSNGERKIMTRIFEIWDKIFNQPSQKPRVLNFNVICRPINVFHSCLLVSGNFQSEYRIKTKRPQNPKIEHFIPHLFFEAPPPASHLFGWIFLKRSHLPNQQPRVPYFI